MLAAGVLERRPLQAARDSRGRIYVSQVPPQGLAYQFEPSGQFRRRIGREGSGPGEYREAATPLIWVMIHVPSENWQAALGAPVDVPQLGRKSYPQREVHRLFDTILEVVDPKAGRIVQSLRVREYLTFFLGGTGTGVGIYSEDSDGLPQLPIGTLKLTR